MNQKSTCPQCDRPLPGHSPFGICPACVANANLESQVAWSTSPGRPPPMSVEEVARLFPEMEILDLIGAGGMGAVYKARQPKLDRLVALKILSGHGDDPRFVDRFTREAQTLARLNHPNIVAVHEFGEKKGHFFLIMELVDGVTLRHLLQEAKIPPEQALAIVPPICEALEYAHEKGVVHRDIKPENILIDKEGKVKVADFGIARLMGDAPREALTGDAERIGTAHYMAPEQVERPAEVDHRADIYALGVVFYEMLTGELPLGRFPEPSKRVAIDVRLDEIVLKALEKEPARRYQMASEMRTGVATVVSTAPSLPLSRESATGQTDKQSSSRLLWTVGTGMAVGLLLLAGLVTVLLTRPEAPPPISPITGPAPTEVRMIAGETPPIPRMKPAVEYPMGEFPQGITLADLDGDGHLDVITANRHDHAIAIRFGRGDGGFGDPVTYKTAPDPVFVRATDLNGNGILDLVTANHSSSVSVFLGIGDGAFSEAVTYSTGEGNLTTLSVAVADFTGNGLPDLVAANLTGNSISLLPGLGGGVFGEAIQHEVGMGPVSIVTGDFNADGHADIAVANRRDNSASILLGNGRGEFTHRFYEIGSRAGFIAAADLTGNGALDLAVPNFDDNTVSLLSGDGQGEFSRRDIDLGRCSASSLALGDMNGDGWVDIVVVCQLMQSLAVYLNGGEARFSSPPRIYRVGPAPDAVAIGDLNGDGHLDMVSANLRGASISVVVTEQADGLNGVVLDNAGIPIRGATVFVHKAKPKDGVDTLGPFNYPDCDKSFRVDASGRFTLNDLASDLLFTVAVAAPGFQPDFVVDVDPLGDPLEIILPTVFPGDAADNRIRGRVVDPSGNPVHGAVVEVQNVATEDGGILWGAYAGMDEVAITDEKGEFVIHGSRPFSHASFRVDARGFARSNSPRLSSGDTIHEIQLTHGITLTGRVVMNGEPVSGIEVGVRGVHRGMDDDIGSYTIGTDPNGAFTFTNLPAHREYFLYGLMQSVGIHGAIPVQRTASGAEETTVDIGDILIEPSHRLEGVVKLPENQQRRRSGIRVYLGRSNAADGMETFTDTEGRFAFSGVPDDFISVSAQIPGHRLSLRNASMDPLNPHWLLGRIHTDKTNLVLEFEPGERRDMIAGDQWILRRLPLRGAEAIAHGDIRVTGTVVDAETGEPVARFTVTEGRASDSPRFAWFEARSSEHQDGSFTRFLDDPTVTPALLVEADGYLPFSSGAISETDVELLVELHRGSGPAGIVLNPDGTPAAGITVYLTSKDRGISLDGSDSTVHLEGLGHPFQTHTDEAGRFSFPPDIDSTGVIAINETGFGEVTVEALRDNPEIVLKRWARIEGQLRIGTEAGANQRILVQQANWTARRQYGLWPNLQTRTDEEGRFVFERVPPILMELYHFPDVRDTHSGPIARSQVTVLQPEPGRTHHLQLGGQGRAAIGNIVLQGFEGEMNWREGVHALIKIPSTTEEQAMEEEYGYMPRFDYALNFTQNGAFRVEDVPPGRYRLTVNLRRTAFGGWRPLTTEVNIPEAPEESGGEPHDLGTIVLEVNAP